MRPYLSWSLAALSLPLMTIGAAAFAQSSAEYTAFLNWCARQGGTASGGASNPVCLPGDSSSSSSSSAEQSMLGIAGALGSALGNAIRESFEADARRAAMQRMQMAWELERARIFATEERERLSREMRERNEALIANLKGGIRAPDLNMSKVGTTQLKLKTADEMFGRPAKVAQVDPKVAWDAYLAALQKRNETALRLTAATDHRSSSQVILDAARGQVETAKLSGSADKLAEAEKLASQADQLSRQAAADLETAKAQADQAAKALELAAADTAGLRPVTDAGAASSEAVATAASAGFDSVNDPMVVDLRDRPSTPAGTAMAQAESDPMVVDARTNPSVLAGLPRLEEVENSPGRDAWLAGMAAAAESDWNVAVPAFETALQKDPGNAALARAVELARWTRDRRTSSGELVASAPEAEKKAIVVPQDADLEFLFSQLIEGPPPAKAVVAPKDSDLELLFAREKSMWERIEEEAAQEPLAGESRAVYDQRLASLSKEIRAAAQDNRFSAEENERILQARIEMARELEADAHRLLTKGDWRGAVALLDRAGAQVPADAEIYKQRSESIRRSFGSNDPVRSLSAKPAPAAPRPSSGPAKPQWELDYEAKMAVYRLEADKQRAAVAEYERAQADLIAKRAQLAERVRRERAEWERAVAACRAGDHSACDKTLE